MQGRLKELCEVCLKSAYVNERLQAEGKFYHKACFKCDECGSTMKIGGYVPEDGKNICKVCFNKRPEEAKSKTKKDRNKNEEYTTEEEDTGSRHHSLSDLYPEVPKPTFVKVIENNAKPKEQKSGVNAMKDDMKAKLSQALMAQAGGSIKPPPKTKTEEEEREETKETSGSCETQAAVASHGYI
ncbi:protein MICAL-3-like [Planoprotostelium fungivorum]|uniref:Protein MICAL-3-like n=1 Tax=Planoprotostelium fungivorum TaxID=1890364 RepID=A0A2P6NER7_9EUKA|nr:protein MICAL-3-like [Planoprotostelium fungivorum]